MWLYAGLAVAAALTLAAAWLNRRAGVAAALAAFGAAWLAFGTIGGTGHDEFGRYSSGALLAPTVRAELAKLPADTPFYSIEMLDHTFRSTWAARRSWSSAMDDRVRDLDGAEQVDSDRRRVDHALEAGNPCARDHAARRVRHPGQKQGVPMRVVARDNRRVIVEKPQS